MELIVVILLVLAVAVFLAAAFVHDPAHPPRFNYLAFGLAMLALAFLLPAFETVQ